MSRSRTTSLLVRVVIAGIVLGLTLPSSLFPGAAQAQEESTELVGIQGSARASGVYVFYNLAGVLPIASPVDSSAPDALTTISTGPSTFARAGVIDPGDLLANPNALLAVGGVPDAGIPEFPYRIQSTSGFGEPAVESAPAPGLAARVEAEANRSLSTASAGRASAPSIIDVGGVTTTATTETDGKTVTVRARTEVADFNLLDVLVIDSIVTEVVAVSDGTETVVSGGTEIGGATLGGQKITIGGDGIEPAPGTTSLLGGLTKSVSQTLTELLEAAGITVTLGGRVESSSGDIASLAATGLRIDLDITAGSIAALGPVFDLLDGLASALPLPGAPVQIADLLQVIRGRQISQLNIGAAEVSLAATVAPTVPDVEFAPSPPADVGTPEAFVPEPITDFSAPTPATPTISNAAPAPARVSPSLPTDSLADSTPTLTLRQGIGALVALLILAQPLFGAAFTRVSRRLLTPSLAADGCALEVRND